MSVTFRDIARETGVTPGTVSRALRGHTQVSEECIARVRASAERLGYRPLRDRSRRSNPEPLAGRQIAIAMFGIDRTLAGLPPPSAAAWRSTAGRWPSTIGRVPGPCRFRSSR